MYSIQYWNIYYTVYDGECIVGQLRTWFALKGQCQKKMGINFELGNKDYSGDPDCGPHMDFTFYITFI